jgi:hypothetical protein
MRMTLKTATVLGFVFLLAGGVARAATLVDATVPFKFIVHNQVFPAGQYRVEQLGDDPAILVITSEHGVNLSIISSSVQATGQDPAGNKPALIFSRGEDGYHLKDVWLNHADGREIQGQ